MTDRSFTLIELLIVVAIIGVLAAIAVPNFLNARVRSQIARAEADLTALDHALEMYRLDNNAYPPDWQDQNIPDAGKRPIGGRFSFSRVNLAIISHHYELTSPIAYLSSLPRDTFESLENKMNQLPPEWIHSYWYLRCGPAPPRSRKEFEVFNGRRYESLTWVLFGRGPDGERQQDLPGVTAKDWLLAYAPSNGLYSRGDLYRMGH
ncbi:MAG TPA: prepilin-type N-terminal cleavage/methylation domain-containing protein [bacterium]|nr:prepilin-type N-terminal cleavage/methylation domain-containing protein [Candidatus Omnitrophota bacterium]HOJ60970.1 prepilin-type N-terminal cleavage/methylation domain-containing protein [bacterium]HOL94472.1 prepilin-type N-terminal cleavage/methylation domain-containing protein [bacterium]HPO99678.1 prepilin-type N-terminal cleavage/methylation domain-containing protein [bacterium]HXK95798.1 prepilin-type N-terminal cleavage/methylation domain-containing protein [bacterium]